MVEKLTWQKIKDFHDYSTVTYSYSGSRHLIEKSQSGLLILNRKNESKFVPVASLYVVFSTVFTA